MDIEKIPPNTTIGTAQYDPSTEEVVDIELNKNILEEYGHRE